MNIALPAFIIILGLLPGMIFVNAYFSGRMPRSLASLTAVSEFALYVCFAAPFLIVGALFLDAIDRPFNYGLLARLLMPAADGRLQADLGLYLRSHWHFCVIGYAVFLCVAALGGTVARRIVWASRLDLTIPFLRLRHDWWYNVQGRLPDQPRFVLPIADVIADHCGESRLFRGIVIAVEVSLDGEIGTLTLWKCQRGKNRGDAFAWKPIPGHRFIIPGSMIKSVNMTYLPMDQARATHSGGDAVPARAPSQAYIWWRSFIYQVP